jgi:predicted PurR-regulated permease PerM
VKDIFRKFNASRAIFLMMLFICIIFAGAVLKIAAGLILPFTIALLLAFVMYPVVVFLDKLKFPRFLSIFLVIIIIVSILYIFGMVLYSSGSSLVSLLPSYESRLTEIYIWIANMFDLPFDDTLSFWDNIWGQLGVRTWVRGLAFSFSTIFLNFLSSAVLVVFFVVFILLEVSYLKEKIETAFENRSLRISRMGKDIITQVTRYLTAKFLISLANGVIFAVAFYFIGLEFAILWGVIQFILNFIPNFGSIAASLGVCLYSLIQFWPEPGPIIMVVAVVLIINLFLCNIFDPKIVGDHVGISPLVVLISLGVWGWIWGFAGMILAVPMTVIIKIVCENIPILEPISILIGTRKSITAKKIETEQSEK